MKTIPRPYGYLGPSRRYPSGTTPSGLCLGILGAAVFGLGAVNVGYIIDEYLFGPIILAVAVILVES